MSKAFISFVHQGASDLQSNQVMASYELVKTFLSENPGASFQDVKVDVLEVGRLLEERSTDDTFATYMLSAYVDENPKDLITNVLEMASKVSIIRWCTDKYNDHFGPLYALVNELVADYKVDDWEYGDDEYHEVSTVDIMAAFQLLNLSAAVTLEASAKGSSGVMIVDM